MRIVYTDDFYLQAAIHAARRFSATAAPNRLR
jgi:hypothetical protein